MEVTHREMDRIELEVKEVEKAWDNACLNYHQPSHYHTRPERQYLEGNMDYLLEKREHLIGQYDRLFKRHLIHTPASTPAPKQPAPQIPQSLHVLSAQTSTIESQNWIEIRQIVERMDRSLTSMIDQLSACKPKVLSNQWHLRKHDQLPTSSPDQSPASVPERQLPASMPDQLPQQVPIITPQSPASMLDQDSQHLPASVPDQPSEAPQDAPQQPTQQAAQQRTEQAPEHANDRSNQLHDHVHIDKHTQANQHLAISSTSAPASPADTSSAIQTANNDKCPHRCHTCDGQFDTRNQLFTHLRASGHVRPTKTCGYVPRRPISEPKKVSLSSAWRT